MFENLNYHYIYSSHHESEELQAVCEITDACVFLQGTNHRRIRREREKKLAQKKLYPQP